VVFKKKYGLLFILLLNLKSDVHILLAIEGLVDDTESALAQLILNQKSLVILQTLCHNI